MWTTPGRTIVFKFVLDDAIMDLIDQVVSYIATLTVNDPFSGNTDILLLFCENQ